MSNSTSLPAAPRHASKLRRAVSLIVIDGLPLSDAAEQAGMTLDGLQRAWTRPAVRQLAADVAADYVRGVEVRMPLLRARAIEAAARLMESGRSDAVRMRAIEAVMGGRTVSPPISPAATDPGYGTGGGYEYVRPGTEPTEW